MQALERTVAAFCTACICSELLSHFIGPGWGRKCIKAVAGLYILVVFADALPGVRAQFAVPELPQASAASIGSLEDAVLLQAQQDLARTLEQACLQKTGILFRLKITLTRTPAGVQASEVEITPEGVISTAQRQEMEAFLTGQLQLAPEDLVWSGPVREDAS